MNLVVKEENPLTIPKTLLGCSPGWSGQAEGLRYRGGTAKMAKTKNEESLLTFQTHQCSNSDSLRCYEVNTNCSSSIINQCSYSCVPYVSNFYLINIWFCLLLPT